MRGLKSGGVAQLVERGIHKPKVSGSSPDAASNSAAGAECGPQRY